MASIRKRGGKWQAQVRKRGAAPRSKTFTHKSDAMAWARGLERAIDTGETYDPSRLAGVTVGDLLARYRDTVTSKKRSAANEAIIVNAMLRAKFSRKSVAEVSAEDFASYRDIRLEEVRPVTINRELGILQHTFELASAEWSLPLARNPLASVRRPKVISRRERRLREGEEAQLLCSADEGRQVLMRPLIELALETAMRRSELLRIEKGHYDLDTGLLDIPQSKNGYPRTIPLTVKAQTILRSLELTSLDKIFPLTGNAVRLSWCRLIRRAGIRDLRFHDFRHEAISRFFEKGLSVPEVALISGHRDYRMLFRYTHMRADHIQRKWNTSDTEAEQ